MAEGLARRLVALPRVYHSRASCHPANRVGEADGRTADRDRPDGETADRHAKSQCCTANCNEEPERGTTDTDQTTGQSADRQRADSNIANRDHAPGDPGTHRVGIDARTYVHERPLADPG